MVQSFGLSWENAQVRETTAGTINKKSELMLMRRATASVEFYTVVVLVRNFVKNSLYKIH